MGGKSFLLYEVAIAYEGIKRLEKELSNLQGEEALDVVKDLYLLTIDSEYVFADESPEEKIYIATFLERYAIDRWIDLPGVVPVYH
ncbi:hypothetical protein L6261_02350 [Candidatus Parcubacteria bacterium]|nr:hypothetical protein [Candidatus Parcubacteria bacterium]